jgi:hypothetical protein
MEPILSAFVRHLNVGAVETRPSISQVDVLQRALILLETFAKGWMNLPRRCTIVLLWVKPPSELTRARLQSLWKNSSTSTEERPTERRPLRQHVIALVARQSSPAVYTAEGQEN